MAGRLQFPVRIFEHLGISRDAHGNEVHTGNYVEFMRDASEPPPKSIEEALLLAQAKCPEAEAIFADTQPAETQALQAIATLRAVAADEKGAALELKDVKGGTINVADEAAALIASATEVVP